MALTLDHVSYTYAASTSYADRALDGVTLGVESGELVLVLGATGSGKSTLLRIASGLLAASAGAASIDGVPLSRDSARGAVGLVFQDAEAQLFAETVLDDVAFGPRNLGAGEAEARAQAREALLTAGLDPDEYGGRSPFALSGGEARRAAIAGVLAMRPRYLLLDEPTAGLDAKARRLLRGAIGDVRATTGMVVVSHSAEEFLGMADRVLLLDGGRAVFDGPAADLVADPAPFEDAHLLAPDVLRVQMAARAGGADPGAFTLDPVAAADAIARAGGWM